MGNVMHQLPTEAENKARRPVKYYNKYISKMVCFL